ncbi:MAG: family 10 glycosylhydrolase [Spirochaetes bacterium]|jgi:hypothetical protein|nr:family 10 glycosylhydrolase [Spirochaetota bacterium]
MKIAVILKIFALFALVTLLISAISLELYDPSMINRKMDGLRGSIFHHFNKRPVLKTTGNVNPSHVPLFRDLPEGYIYTGHILTFTPAEDLLIDTFCETSIRFTRYFYLNRYRESFIQTNGIEGNSLSAGKTYLVPEPDKPMIFNVYSNQDSRNTFARTVYFSNRSISSEKMIHNLLTEYKTAGINAIVFDVKDVPGYLSYKSSIPDVIKFDAHKHRGVDEITKLIRLLKENDIYVIARISCFRDIHVTKLKPEWAIQSADGSIWNQGKGEIWLDPTNKEVQDYIIQIADEVASFGVDEIQFDYIRFPTDGDRDDARFTYSYGAMSRVDIITAFLKRAYTVLKKRNVLVSIDIFGVVAWGNENDINSTGQQISRLAPYCDIICPMLYPSHFNNNFRGIEKPGDSPYYFISEGVNRVKSQAKGTFVRPWLQAFGWRVTNYNGAYIQEQIRASIDTGAEGYIFWNAKNNYDTVLEGMSQLEEIHK